MKSCINTTAKAIVLATLLLQPTIFAMGTQAPTTAATAAVTTASSNPAVTSQSTSGISSTTKSVDGSHEQEQKFMVIYRESLQCVDESDFFPPSEDGETSSAQVIPCRIVSGYGSINAFSGECVFKLREHANTFSIISKTGKLVAGCTGRSVKIWDITNNSIDKKPLKFKNRKNSITAMTVYEKNATDQKAPMDTIIAAGSQFGAISLWRLNNNNKHELYRTLSYEDTSDLLSRKAVITLTLMNKEYLAALYANGVVLIWDVAQQEINKKLQDDTNPIISIATLENGDLAAGFTDHTIKIFNLEKNEWVSTLSGHQGAVRVLYAMPGGFLLSGSDDTTVKVWDPRADYPCLHTFKGHRAAISALTYFPAKGLIASGDIDGYIRVWDTTANNNPLICTMQENKNPILTLATHQDSLYSLSLANDGICFWR